MTSTNKEMDTTAIKQEIDEQIKPNGREEITGQVLNETLKDMVDATTPKFYSEDKDTNDVNINTDAAIKLFANEKVELRTSGYIIKISEEGGVKIGADSESVIEIRPAAGVTINDERVLVVSDLSFVFRVLGVDWFYDNLSYHVGDLVLYQNLLYQFTADHQGAWSWNDVEETNLRKLLNF